MENPLLLFLCTLAVCLDVALANGVSGVSNFPMPSSRGEAWPLPFLIKNAGMNFSVLQPGAFMFELGENAVECDILQAAVSRYYDRTFPSKERSSRPFGPAHPMYPAFKSTPGFRGSINKLQIVMNNARGCQELPELNMDEHYELKIDSPDSPGVAQLIAFTNWGILRGLETFSQLVYQVEESGGMYQINSTQIMDSPRFSHRSILLDTSRHFITKKVILDNLDLMEMNKMNVFHWHLTDDQSFPYQSALFPNMSLYGAYQPYTHIYSQEDIKEIVEYARIRGIRVMPEFDSPGHSTSWGLGQPGILTECYTEGKPDGGYGPMNPTKPQVYDFLEKFFGEITKVFPEAYVHLGGDEVNPECWSSNPNISAYVNATYDGDYSKLQTEYMNKLTSIISSYPTNNSYMVWQEVFFNNGQVSNESVIEVWIGSGWQDSIAAVTKAGLRGVVAAPWYLDYIRYGPDWKNYYTADPQNFTGTDAQKDLVMGGEACLWAENVNSANLLPRMWPRASAVAERLWSAKDVNDPELAAGRLHEHECRMILRGYPVEPTGGPGFCYVEPH